MRDYQAKNVEEYIAGAPAIAQPHLNSLRELIKSTVPQAEESISWGVPFYKYHGLLGGFSVFTHHLTFGLAFILNADLREKFEAAGYSTGSKTVQIKFDQAMPTALIRQMLLDRVEANELRQ